MVNWLLKQDISQKNDMDDSKEASLLKDYLSLMVETEGAADPLFGNMYIQDQPSPRSLLQGHHLRHASPQHPGQEETPLTWSSTSDNGLGRGTTASPETITLREPEPVPLPVAEFEATEFGDHPGDTIDLLLAQTDQFLEGDILREVPIPEPEADVEREQERREADTDRDRTKEQTESTAELQPTTLSSEDHMMPPQEEPDLPLQPVKPPTDQLTPVSAPVQPSPPSVADRRKRRREESESESSPEETERRRRRRRQLVFIDLETQLPQEEMQQQINDLQIQTAAASILPSPSHMPSAAELFNNPCTSPVPEELLLLWRQAATITPLAGSDLQAMERGTESSESEREREREMAEMLEMAEREEQERREESSKEFPRDEAEVEQLDISAMTALPLEASDQMEASRESSPLVTPVKERSVVSRPVSVLKDIPEETADEAEGPKPCSPGLLPELEHEAGPVNFLSSLPPGATRRTVSHSFMKLLEDLSARKLQAEQREPYGDIVLSVF